MVYNNQTRNMKIIEILSNSVNACSSNLLGQIHNYITSVYLYFIYNMALKCVITIYPKTILMLNIKFP